jgi:hypothetical protein
MATKAAMLPCPRRPGKVLALALEICISARSAAADVRRD